MKVGAFILVGVVITGVWVSAKALASDRMESPSLSEELTIATFLFPIGEPVTVTSGDFDKDGHDELFVVTAINEPSMTIGPRGLMLVPNPKYEMRFFVLAFRDNNFGEPFLVDAIPAPDQIIGPHKPIVIDLDNDGKLDVIVLLFFATLLPETVFEDFKARLLIYWGQGDYTFVRTEVPLDLAYVPFINPCNQVGVGDLDSDGLFDLLFPDSRYVRLKILYNFGNRNFSDPEHVWVQQDGDECLPIPLSIHVQNDIIIVAGPCLYSENEFDFFVRTISRSEHGGWEYSPLFLRNRRVQDFEDAVWDIGIVDVNADGQPDILFLGPPELAEPSIPRVGPSYVGLYLVEGKNYEKIARPDFVAWVEKGTFLSIEAGVDGGLVILVLPEVGIRYKHLWVVTSSGWMTSSRTLGGRGHLVDGVLINRSTTRELILLASVDFESEITVINVVRGW